MSSHISVKTGITERFSRINTLTDFASSEDLHVFPDVRGILKVSVIFHIHKFLCSVSSHKFLKECGKMGDFPTLMTLNTTFQNKILMVS